MNVDSTSELRRRLYNFAIGEQNYDGVEKLFHNHQVARDDYSGTYETDEEMLYRLKTDTKWAKTYCIVLAAVCLNIRFITILGENGKQRVSLDTNTLHLKRHFPKHNPTDRIVILLNAGTSTDLDPKAYHYQLLKPKHNTLAYCAANISKWGTSLSVNTTNVTCTDLTSDYSPKKVNTVRTKRKRLIGDFFKKKGSGKTTFKKRKIDDATEKAKIKSLKDCSNALLLQLSKQDDDATVKSILKELVGKVEAKFTVEKKPKRIRKAQVSWESQAVNFVKKLNEWISCEKKPGSLKNMINSDDSASVVAEKNHLVNLAKKHTLTKFKEFTVEFAVEAEPQVMASDSQHWWMERVY